MFDFALIVDSLPTLGKGLVTTVWISGLSIAIGLLIAVPTALMRTSNNPVLRWPSKLFILYFRGTPLLVQIFLIYYGTPQFKGLLETIGLWTLFKGRMFCAVLALTLNTAAYTAEILRGAIESVPFGERESARAAGMSGALLQRRIVLPVAFRLAWPAYTNEVVFLLQASSLVSIITVPELTNAAQYIADRHFAIYEMYITIALMYLVVVYGLLFVFRKIEHRITGHLRDRAEATEPVVEPVL